jgi:hypothetical protein
VLHARRDVEHGALLPGEQVVLGVHRHRHLDVDAANGVDDGDKPTMSTMA